MTKQINTYQQLDGKVALKICQSKRAAELGVEVRPAAGDHFIAKCARLQTTECIPYEIKSNGVRHSVWKWLVSVGLLGALVCMLLGYLVS